MVWPASGNREAKDMGQCDGRVAFVTGASLEIVRLGARKVHCLDGKTALGDAALPGDPESTAGG